MQTKQDLDNEISAYNNSIFVLQQKVFGQIKL